MKVSAAFPSEFLRAVDLDGRNVTVVIDRVEMREVGDDHKPVLFFKGKEKGVVLNKTNSATVAAQFGDEMDDWSGAEIVLYPTSVQFQNKMVEAIRIKIPPRKPARTAAGSVVVNDKPVSRSETNPPPIDEDDIPF